MSTHRILKSGSGRQSLGHITRSGVLMLCAAWELFSEELLLEGIRRISENVDDPNQLPNIVKKVISNKVKNDIHDLKPIQLARDGWKVIWLEYATIETDLLNTPKPDKIEKLYKLVEPQRRSNKRVCCY